MIADTLIENVLIADGSALRHNTVQFSYTMALLPM